MSEMKVLENNPLRMRSADKILRDDFFGDNANFVETQTRQQISAPVGTPAPAPDREPVVIAKPKKAKPTHYKVVCISLYTQDIENLEATVAELKRRGHTKANKSQLIRQALRQLDIDKLPAPQQ